MRKQIIALLIHSILPFAAFCQLGVKHLLCEDLDNPISIDVANPRFSWQLVTDKRNTLQTAYEIKVNASPGGGAVWESGKVNSDMSIYVPYGGAALKSAHKYNWQVRVWDNNGNASPWSEVGSFQMGMLQPSDWKAKWIESTITDDSVNTPAILFRRQFNSPKKVQTAIAYITTHGMYEAHINGKRVGDAYLTPGWTSYAKRLQYQAYDVKALLDNGANSVGITVGSGWFRTPLGWVTNKELYGRKLALLFQLEITFTDGSHTTISSDENWKSSNGAIRSSEMYNGEIYNANEDKKGWGLATYTERDWKAVNAIDYPKNILVATYNQPVRKHETFPALRMFTTPAGERVIDFGQNLVGWVQVKVTGQPGSQIIISHAEVLDKKGNFYTENLRAAKAQNVYVLKGGREEIFEPHFTFQGFRYIKIEGNVEDLKPGNFTAVALYSDMPVTGKFSCSHPLLNQLQHNIQWGQKGNFLDVPTDCPQRDERLGWTGDAQAFSRTATYNMDVHNFFLKWLKDVAADQGADGRVPFVVPNILGPTAGGSTGWADVATIIPWNVYLAFGDKKVLEDQYASMKRWVSFMQNKSKGYLWNTGFHFGDWLFYRPFDDNDGRSAVTDKFLIAQCFFAHSTQLVINAAQVLGKTDDVASYTDLLKHIKEAFVQEYMTPNGRLVSGTQTAYVLALNFDMLPESLRMQAAQRLADNVKDYDNHLTTGFLGTPYLCHVLSRFGFDDVSYKLLLQETYPSWLYPVKMGATTIWERWDGQKPDSTFQTPGMNSFNHYAYGAIGDWMYRVMAGLDTYSEGPGYKKIKIQPHLGGNITYANADLNTGYGTAAVHWKKDNGIFTMDVTIPANTTARVYLPASASDHLKEGEKNVSEVSGIKVIGKEGTYVLVEVGSGTYHFSAN